jgi:hypothetical protein
MKISQAKKEKGARCCAYGCGNAPVARKGGLCHKHYTRKRREVDPVGVRYGQFIGNAKQRGKDCDVTLEQFRQFCHDNDYIVKKGMRGKNATIDRIVNEIGYTIPNMQILSLSANASKGSGSYEPDKCPF